jgi:predicted dithiol-disulfide oxidoreductase (DUF899 family)
MTSHKTGTREEWLAARLELLEAEKELTRRGDELSRRGRSCPGSGSTRTTASRPARGRRRWPACSGDARSCSSTTSCSGPATPPVARPARRSPTASTASSSTSPTTTSRCVQCRGLRWRKFRRTSGGWGWSFPWASSYGSDFSFDLQAASTPEQQRSGTGEYNFRPMDMRSSLEAGEEGPLAEWAASCGTDWPTYARERPGMSAFALENGVVYHLLGLRARPGRPVGHVPVAGPGTARTKRDAYPRRPRNWYRRHDEYDNE